MKASELRIGNLVWDYNVVHPTEKYVEVIGVYSNIFKDIISLVNVGGLKYLLKLSLIKPIPLTEECLFKFGFEYSHRIGSRNFYNIKTFYIEICEYRCAVYYTNKGELICFINSAHQLQNLYFALTNEELTIKTEKL
jgi:hypothetical protein